MARNAPASNKIATTSRLVREAVGVPPIARWQYKGEPAVIVESYLFPSRARVVLPKFPVPIIGTQLDGRKLVYKKSTNVVAGNEPEDFPYTIPNRCVLIPPDTESYWTPGTGNVTLSGIYVGGEGEAAARRILAGGHEPVMLRDSVLVALTRQLLHLALDRRPMPAGYEDLLIRYLVAHLEWLANAPLAARLVRSTIYDATISGVLHLIEENLEEPLTMSFLAATADMSVALFRKRFKEIVGVSVHQYVLKARIERASELIDDCNLPLATIAVQCGFSNQSHMTRMFRRELGVTPARLRQRSQPIDI